VVVGRRTRADDTAGASYLPRRFRRHRLQFVVFGTGTLVLLVVGILLTPHSPLLLGALGLVAISAVIAASRVWMRRDDAD
jgi:hypothetical protein